jgi:hypothetical protein
MVRRLLLVLHCVLSTCRSISYKLPLALGLLRMGCLVSNNKEGCIEYVRLDNDLARSSSSHRRSILCLLLNIRRILLLFVRSFRPIFFKYGLVQPSLPRALDGGYQNTAARDQKHATVSVLALPISYALPARVYDLSLRLWQTGQRFPILYSVRQKLQWI